MKSKKEKSIKQKIVTFFERGSWYHRTKTLQEDYTVKYGKLGGFNTKEETEESYYKLEKEFIRKLSVHNIKSKKETLNIAIKDAVIEGYVNYNPVPRTKVYKRKRKKIVILCKDDIRKLLSLASKDSWYLEILLGLACGLRKGEIAGLKFSDFNLENKTVTIRRQLVRDPIIKKVKEESKIEVEECKVIERLTDTRILKVHDAIIKELNRRKGFIDLWKMNYEGFEDNDYISCQENGKPHHINSLNTYLYRLCINNVIPHISVHGLRNIYTANLIESDMPLVKISGLLGHKSINTTFEIYLNIVDEKEEIKAFINNNFSPEEVEVADGN